eukprot:Em0015g396a
MWGKACRILQSSGIAPNNDTTWQLLNSKHPSCPTPVPPVVHTTPVSLEPDFNIIAILRSYPKDTAAGPSGLQVQHLLDAISIPLHTPICPSRRQVINILIAGKAPTSVSRFLAGASLIALNRIKEGCPPDIRPIAVGETLRRLAGKCVCALLKDKAADFFQTLQLGVACRAGAEKIAHGVRRCIEEHWMDEDFVVFKVDMQNAFNVVSRQAVLDECSTFFPELIVPWRPAVLRALHLIEEMGPALGLHVNLAKCELFSRKGNTSFPPDVSCSLLPNLDILGAPIVDVAAVKLQVAVTLLRMCGSFCRMVHIARVTPPSLASDALRSFDEEVQQCFALCTAIEVPNEAWCQAQLGLKFGGLGLRSLSIHAAAAFMASLSSSGFGSADYIHLQQAVVAFNSQVSLPKGFGMIEDQLFSTLLESFSHSNRARLLSVAAPHSSSWLSVVPSPGLGLHLESNEYQMAIKWWLGLDTSGRSMCPFCPDTALDPLGHHAVTCRHGGDVVIRHNRFRDEIFDLCSHVHLSVRLEGKPAALDITITSPLCPAILGESCHQTGAAVLAADTRKLHSNGPKCQELGWSCIPLAVETYGNWGKETQDTISRLASHLAIHQSSPKSSVVAEIYGRLDMTLGWSVVRTILARELPPS